jgi:hypothetical protein
MNLAAIGGHPATMADVEEVKVAVAQHEGTALRIGEVFLKIDADQTLTGVEVEIVEQISGARGLPFPGVS